MDFREDTRITLEKCGIWLTEHACELTDAIVGGCRDWSITFSAGEDGLFPTVSIVANKIDLDLLSTAYGSDFNEDELVVRHEDERKIELDALKDAINGRR